MNYILDYPFLETGLLSPPCFVHVYTAQFTKSTESTEKYIMCRNVQKCSVLEVQDIHYVLAFSRTKCKRDLKF